jgi:PIN domain nuclease of toxin-antitoxin system
VTGSLLLDTHVVLWLDSGDHRLRAGTRNTIDRLWLAGGSVLVSAVSAWEIALLADTGRISLDCPPEAWIERFLGRPGVAAVPLSWRASARAYGLPNFERRDPGDRLLIATAIELGCPLVTYDGPITDYAAGHGRQTGLRIVGE